MKKSDFIFLGIFFLGIISLVFFLSLNFIQKEIPILENSSFENCLVIDNLSQRNSCFSLELNCGDDVCFFERALEANSFFICERISDNVTKRICFDEVSYDGILNDALRENNSSLCKNLENVTRCEKDYEMFSKFISS